MKPLDDGAVAALRAFIASPGPGEIVGDRFELLAPIGRGGMGTVFRALDRLPSTDGADGGAREVALKLVSTGDEAEGARFERECVALSRVAHPAIVRYLAHGRDGEAPLGVSYLAMELVRGPTLAERLARGRLSVSDAVAFARALAGGLAAMHAVGLVHRDVKPANVIVAEDAPARCCLVDFGLVRLPDGSGLTQTGSLVGTPGYMAPEQVRGEREIGPSADVFALGCVLFECLAGQPAFLAETTKTVLARILLEAPASMRALRTDLPAALEDVVSRMLAKDADARPTAQEVDAALARLPLPLESPSEIGSVVDEKYCIEERIGEGGMGIVFAARHLVLRHRVALKLLRRRRVIDDARFLREAQAAARLESEHVARVLDIGRLADGTPYIAMELLNGTDLARHLVGSAPLAPAVVVGYVLEACEAIAEAHSLGIVHRDLKPANLFLVRRRDGREQIKVLDFGISKLTTAKEGAPDDEALSLTDTASAMGSTVYMSPEQLHDSKRVDVRTDVWALGVVLFELLTGQRPFLGESAAAVGARIAAGHPTPMRSLRPDVPAALEVVVHRCLEKDPAARWADLAALTSALLPFAPERAASVTRVARLLGGTLPSARSDRAEGPTENPPHPAKRSRAPAWLLIVAVAAAIPATWVFARQRSAPSLGEPRRLPGEASPSGPTASSAALTSALVAPAPLPTSTSPSTSTTSMAVTSPSPKPSAPTPSPVHVVAVPAQGAPLPTAKPLASAVPSAKPKPGPKDVDLGDPALVGL